VVGNNPIPLVNHFAVLDPISSGKLPINPFKTLVDNGSASTPKSTIDNLSFVQMLGTLHPGDILSYVYTLTAEGTTHGAEQGFLAFVGDPFDLAATGGGFELTAVTAAVPEPESWALSLVGLVLISMKRWRSTRSAPVS